MSREEVDEPLYLLRVWGRDKAQVVALKPPDARERLDGPYCYWFKTSAERDAFIARFPPGCHVVRATHDPTDRDGDPVDTHALTVAIVTLKLPDGRVGTFEQSFGYGYPASSVESMWREGNYSCDCNKRLYLARECGIDPQYDTDEIENPCGDTIELVSIESRRVRTVA